MTEDDVLLLDACSLINIFASRHFEEILSIRRERCAIVRNVQREARSLRRGGDGLDSNDRESIDWSAASPLGQLPIINDPSEDESQRYFDLSLELGDGESMTGAIAFYRGYGVVTDDRKATRILGDMGITMTSSIGLVAEWANQQGISRPVLQTIVTDIRVRARYQPPRTHPRYSWWVTALEGEA